MSYDLGVFYTERPLSVDDAFRRYAAFCSGDCGHLIEPNPNIAAFLRELTARYPQIHDVADADLEGCPWSGSFDTSDGHALIPMRFSMAEKVTPVVVSLAEKHGLVCVDPQARRIRTLPPDLIVDKTEPSKEEVEADSRRHDAPLIALIDELLVPRGFRRRSRIWRRESERAISAVQADDFNGIFELAFCLWSKEEGDEATPNEVKPNGGKFHVREELDGELLPERLHFRVMRAAHFNCDYADLAPELYGDSEEDIREIESYFEPREPLTMAWRVATLREAMDGYVLPFFDRVDAGEHREMISEQEDEEA